MIALDAGRAANGGNPPATFSFRDATIPNPRKDSEPRTILGVEQKAWFKDQLKRSTATWKIWANSLGALDIRIDPEHFPTSMVEKTWPANTFGILRTDDWGAAYHERGEIYDLIRDAKITGFGIVSGDRHSFWAGYAAAKLPPSKFEPVGVSFVGGSLVSPGAMEGFEHGFKKDRTMRPLYLADRPGREARVDLQLAAEARRPVGARICQVLRPRAGARRCPTRRSRRISSSSTRAGTAMRRCG